MSPHDGNPPIFVELLFSICHRLASIDGHHPRCSTISAASTISPQLFEIIILQKAFFYVFITFATILPMFLAIIPVAVHSLRIENSSVSGCLMAAQLIEKKLAGTN